MYSNGAAIVLLVILCVPPVCDIASRSLDLCELLPRKVGGPALVSREKVPLVIALGLFAMNLLALGDLCAFGFGLKLPTASGSRQRPLIEARSLACCHHGHRRPTKISEHSSLA